MSTFDEQYARFYDLLYAGKDYEAEAGYIAGLIKGHQPGASRILELGCGTGRHAEILARDGFEVYGVDRSEQMVRQAASRISAAPELAGRLSFTVGDVTSYNAGASFDAVISLFHVVSYQTTNAEVRRMFDVVSKHLAEGGVFVFDVWYGPAVIEQKPAVRVKRLEDEALNITRIAEPVLDVQRNTVEVNYTLHFVPKEGGIHHEAQESHLMRYFFLPELELMLELSGLKLARAEEWMTGKEPSSSTWGVTVLAVKMA